MNIQYNFENEIKILRYINISHFIVIITSIYLYFVGLDEFYFSSKGLYTIQKYSIIFIAISVVIPTLLIIFVPMFKNNLKIIQNLKTATFVFLIISFVVGLLINVSIWKTSTEAESFIKECPYHFNDTLLNSIIDKSLEEKDSNKNIKFCDVRICALYSEKDEETLAYNYICNYDSSSDFKEKNNGNIYKRINSNNIEISSSKYIQCMKIKTFSAANNDFLIAYMNLCEPNTLYKCDLFEKPISEDINMINNIESCPSNNYKTTALLLAISFLLIDIICFVFLFLVEFLILQKMIYVIELPPIEEPNKDNQATINSTINRNNEHNNHEENENAKESVFRKEMTQTIIVSNSKMNNQNDELFISPLKTRDDSESIQNEERRKRIPNLKNPSNKKLINLNINVNKSYDEDEKSANINENNENEHKILDLKTSNYNEHKKNRKSQFSHQEQLLKSADTSPVIIKSRIINNEGNEEQLNDNQVYTIYPLRTHEIVEKKEKNEDEDDNENENE